MGKLLRVLLVEDSEHDAALILRELRRGGYDPVFTRVESADALSNALASQTWDIVISDFSMPRFSGLDAAALVKQRSPDVPLIMVSGTIGEETAVTAMKAGVQDYVMKGNLKRLCAAIERELREALVRRQREWAEQALRASEERYRELFENANDIVFTHDLAGNFTSLNKAGEQITGYSRAEALRMNIAQLLAAEYRPLHRRMLDRALSGERLPVFELEIEARKGRRVALEVSMRLTYANGTPIGVQGIARDVTERKQMEDQLRQSQKMEAVGRLAGGIAHDFNNLLTVIKGYSDLLFEESATREGIHRAADRIRQAADHAASLTQQLLAFSRRQRLHARVLDMNDVVSKTEKLLRRLIGEDIDLMTSLEPGLARVKADAGQVEQVIMNLAVNARDAMPNGGKLTISTGNVDLDENYARSHASVRPGPYVMLAVADTGYGMDAATQARIFEPFFTTKEIGKGTGLGLATVYGIVKQSGGHIWVYSEPGQGATFKVYLPRFDGVEEEEEAPPSPGPPPRGSETVLVVEDEAAVRELARDILGRNGYSVLEASDGAEALRLISAHRGPLDLVITDVVMPGMSGRELAEQIAARRPHTKILYMSGYTDDAIVHHGVLEHGIPFLEKPFSAEALVRRVYDVLAGRSGEK